MKKNRKVTSDGLLAFEEDELAHERAAGVAWMVFAANFGSSRWEYQGRMYAPRFAPAEELQRIWCMRGHFQ